MKLEEYKQRLKQTFWQSDDLILRQMEVGSIPCLFAFLDGGTDKLLLEQSILRPLSTLQKFDTPYDVTLQQTVSYCEQIKSVPLEDSPSCVAEGDVILFVQDCADVFVFSLRKFEHRSISEPPTQSVMKGPREGFIEAIKPNLSLVRQRIKSPDLVVKMMNAGRYSTTSIAVLHISGVADDNVVKQICAKIEGIDIDGIIDSAYVLSFLQEHKHSFFLQAGTTEKPDVACAKLLEGRVLILVDGSPIAITLPYLLFEDVQDGYDYYSGDWRASMIRFVRLMGALMTVLLPGAYVALQTYHFQLLPLKFLMTLMSATNAIPFPPAIEMLIVLVLFEVLNQASIRMPRYFGISLSVVGAIVLGDTAVKAGLISSPAVLTIALSAIGIFCVPDQVGTLSILRLLYLCISAVTGFVGMILLTLLFVGYLASLENFGAPYLAPYAPRINPDLKDAMFKQSTKSMALRPYSIPTANRQRIENKGD